jgi:hypothetical protein
MNLICTEIPQRNREKGALTTGEEIGIVVLVNLAGTRQSPQKQTNHLKVFSVDPLIDAADEGHLHRILGFM